MNNNELLAGLSKSANILVNSMKQKLGKSGKGGYPPAIQASIVVDTPKTTMDGSSIDIKLGGKDAPMARAFEWGSGIRAERGNKDKYPIPKNPTGVAFLWTYPSPLGLKLKPGDEFVSFDQVQHPGIAPRPYIKPSIDETKDEIRKVLGQSFKAALLIGTQKVTIIEVK